MGYELRNFRPKAVSVARVTGALAMIALLASAAAIAQAPATSPARIGIVVDAPFRSLQPDESARILVRVENTGAGQAGSSRLQIPVADGLSAQTWNCTAHAGASCASLSGSGAVDQSLAGLSAGGWVEYTLDANVSSAPPAFIDVQASTTLAASARCAGGQTQPCRSQMSLPTGVSLYLDVSSTSDVLQPGSQVSYTITSRSFGEQSSTSGSVLRSPVPNGLTDSRWTCTSSVGACAATSGNGPIEQLLGDFSDGEISFQVHATVSSTPPATIVQSAAITPPYGGSCARSQGSTAAFTSAPCVARKALATTAKILVTRTQDYQLDAGTASNRFVLQNAGANAGGSIISAALPDGALGMTWSCSSEGATCPQTNGSGAIEHTVGSWPTSAKLIYDLDVQRDAAGRAVKSASMSVMPSVAATCGTAGTPPPCQAVDARPETAVFELRQQADRVGAQPGEDLEILVTIANISTDIDAQDVVFSVPLADGIDAITSWTCTSANPAIACPVASGEGPITQRFSEFGPGSRFTYELLARTGSRPPATIDARATLVAPTTASMGCVSGSGSPVNCESSISFSTVPILALEQSATATSLSAGGLVDYVLDIFNLGADAGVVKVENVLPESLAGASWVCSGLGMGCPSSSGNGNISESIAQMPEGSSVRYSVSAQVSGELPESVSNVLVAAPEAGGRCHSDASGSLSAVPCSDRFDTSFSPLLELSQSSAERQLIRGGVVNYSVTLKNTGGAPADAGIGMALPDGISHLDWSCSGYGGAVCSRTSGSGEIDETVVALPASGYLTFSIRAVLAQDAPDSITNQVISTPAGNARCATTECNSTLSLPVTAVPSAHLQISATSPTPVVQSGGAALWMVDVRNLGSEIAGAFDVRHVLENSGFEPTSWTCEGTECPADSGSGALEQTVKSLSVYQGDGSEREVGAGRVVFKVIGTINRQPEELATLSAVVAPAAGDTCGPVDCMDSRKIPVEVRGGTLLEIFLNSNDFEVFPNSQVVYNFTILNNGGASVSNVTAFSIEPPEFTSVSWTCVANGGTACPASGTGTINELITFMPVGSSVVFQITANTASNLPATIDYEVGANAVVDFCVPSSCTATLSLPLRDELLITLDANPTTIIPGGSVDYTFRLENTGGGDIFGIDAVSIEPVDFTSSSWTCVATGGANCMPSGLGPIFEPLSSMPAGSSVTFTITAIAATDLPATVDFEVRAELGGQGAAPTGALPCNPVSCSVVLSLPSGTATPPTFSLSKTANQTSLEPGGTVRYTVIVANTGMVDGGDFALTDVVPPGLDSFSWTCSSQGDAACAGSSGTGDLDEYIEYMAPDSSITWVIDAVVSSSASGTVRNLASLVPFSPIVCEPASCAVASTLPVGQQADLDVSKTADPASGLSVGAGLPIAWVLRANNSGGATNAPVVLNDRIPTNVNTVSVSPGSGVSCNTLNPQPGADLICTVAAGFTGERAVNISAIVNANATGTVTNTVNASGSDGPTCSSCTVSNPVATGIDAGIENARAFSAGGLAGTLIDIVNMAEAPAEAATVIVTPASSLQFFAPYASGCTATPGAGDSIEVSCPNPPSTQGVACSGNLCTIGSLPQNMAVTLFVALNAGTSATVRLSVPGDADQSDNTLVLPLGGTP